MTLNQLRYFVSASKHKSLTAAAKEYFVSQPAVTVAIKDLEKQLGVRLLHRNGKNFSLTAEGQILYKKAEELLTRAEEIEITMKDLANKHNVINLGIPPMLASILFADIYIGFSEMHPEIEIKTQENGFNQLKNDILDEIIDVGIFPSNDFSQEFEFVNLQTRPLIFGVSVLNPLSRFDTLTIDQIKDEPVVMYKEGFLQNRIVNQLFEEEGLKANIIHKTSQFAILEDFVSKNLAIAIFYHDAIKDNEKIKSIPFNPALTSEISIAWKRNKHIYNDTLKFINYIIKTLRDKI